MITITVYIHAQQIEVSALCRISSSGSLSLDIKMCFFSGEQEKNLLFVWEWDKMNLSLTITIFYHSASLVMPNGDPRDVLLFYLSLTFMMEFYIPIYAHH